MTKPFIRVFRAVRGYLVRFALGAARGMVMLFTKSSSMTGQEMKTISRRGEEKGEFVKLYPFAY
jgi:hypothetical protein